MSEIHRCDTCTECLDEPRASRMPSHLSPVDPAFLAAINQVPEDAKEEEGK